MKGQPELVGRSPKFGSLTDVTLRYCHIGRTATPRFPARSAISVRHRHTQLLVAVLNTTSITRVLARLEAAVGCEQARQYTTYPSQPDRASSRRVFSQSP